MYHSVGNCVFAFLEAMLTFEQQHIIEASEALKLCLHVCNSQRKKTTITESIGKTFKRSNYDQYTEIEAHAELCSAEALLLVNYDFSLSSSSMFIVSSTFPLESDADIRRR